MHAIIHIHMDINTNLHAYIDIYTLSLSAWHFVVSKHFLYIPKS